MERPTVAVTMGDPAGVGAEVIVGAYPAICDAAAPLVVGDADVLRAAVAVCESDLTVTAVDSPSAADADPTRIPVLDLDNVDADALTYGEVREDYGAASLEYVERAIELATDGAVDAIATAPINKQATRCAGSTYAGHTGMLADYTDTDEYAMMLVEGIEDTADGAAADLIVTHVSTHVPLTEACNRVSRGRVRTTIDVTHEGLRDLGIDDPTIAVAGLNPHASDGGILGVAEGSEIEPAVDHARADGLDVHGPESPDTVFAQAAGGAYDCVVAMYHDQGHIPIKMLGFASDDAVSGVNVTVGLPIVRTSVDHGTAFDIAGEGCASEASMVDAVEVAARIARNRARRGDGDGAEAADLPDAGSG
ncbi:4-hydroxythreonine-4-phosphate dehydrogenase [Halosimplex carlsbadense 2-9-1]|uniref:4-hydroxythreonine-4-phosphate dehydrogenase n=1 Tax=Halosimplex carlsbadense 2-9-1 TaxID=797114 RepID=M0D415_9EURY|nr:4-hydroxythreonine-4-phosphate dehydrogenase PdxA [Halosimplex carlsbadense]ELZ29427.1 4-hydroxythreonine-4-phosphate dehydrogenase [Halosimplex carlsbadense 2-9-1]